MSTTTQAAWDLIRNYKMVIQPPEGARVGTVPMAMRGTAKVWHYADGTSTLWPWGEGRLELRFDHETSVLYWYGWGFNSTPPPNLPPMPFKLYPLIPAVVLAGAFIRDTIYDQYGEEREPEPIATYVIYGTLEEAKAVLARFLTEVAPEVRPTDETGGA